MPTKDFFAERTESSEVKTEIVNDENRENIIALEHEVKTITGITLLKYPPVFLNSTVERFASAKT